MSAHLFSAASGLKEPAWLSLQGAGPSDMRPGAELDEVVKQKLMRDAPVDREFHPTAQIADAWKVHQRMDRLPNHVLASYLSELHRILFARWRERTGARVVGPDTPGYLMELDAESICRAALKAANEFPDQF
jgi:hypothetical protein